LQIEKALRQNLVEHTRCCLPPISKPQLSSIITFTILKPKHLTNNSHGKARTNPKSLVAPYPFSSRKFLLCPKLPFCKRILHTPPKGIINLTLYQHLSTPLTKFCKTDSPQSLDPTLPSTSPSTPFNVNLHKYSDIRSATTMADYLPSYPRSL